MFQLFTKNYSDCQKNVKDNIFEAAHFKPHTDDCSICSNLTKSDIALKELDAAMLECGLTILSVTTSSSTKVKRIYGKQHLYDNGSLVTEILFKLNNDNSWECHVF